MQKRHIFILLALILNLTQMASAQFSGGSGTSSSPYLISSASDWNALATNVNGGNDYSGKYFQLTSNISVTTMVGTVKLKESNEDQCQEDKCFAGTFDGGGHTLTVTLTGTISLDGGRAPFRSVKNATIRNLVVTGTVAAPAVSTGNTLSRHAGGLVGFVEESTGCTIENCLVSTNVGTGTDYAGGIIGHARYGSVVMRGCVYTGTLTVSSGGQVGGLIGWNDNDADNTITITNCFFKGTTSGTVANFHPIMCGSRAAANVTITNTYHTKDVAGTVSTDYTGSKHAYTVTGATGVTVARSGNPTATYNTSKITAYSQGVVYDGTIYAGNGNNSIGLSLSYLPGYITYTATNGSLSGSGHTGSNDAYTLNKNANGNTVINVTLLKTHIASTASDYQMTWAQFATAVRGGTSYSGITVFLDEDVNGGNNMAGTIGNNDVGKSFSGTFDGQGHTLTVSIAATTSDTLTQGVAPFRSISNATIKNLVVSGSVSQAKGNPHTAGLVGFTGGTNTIENCLIHTNVTNTNTSGGNRHVGGIIGHTKSSTVTLKGCVYDGTLKSELPKGGLIGWSSASTITLKDCLFNGNVTGTNSSEDSQYFHPIGCKDSNTPTVTINNCYYTEVGTLADDNTQCIVLNSTNKGKFAYTITGDSNVGVARRDNTTATYNVSRLDAYNPAIVYDGTLYAANGENIPLNLSCPGYYFTAYSATNGTLGSGTITGNNDAYTLGKTTGNTVISVTDGVQKFHIANATSSTQMTLEQFAAAVNFGITYSGQTVYVDEDIANTTVTSVAGTASKPFQGTFEGNGHTVTFTCSANVTDKGLLGYVSGAGTVRNVMVNATLSGTSTAVGTVVGTFASTGVIANVEGMGSISGSATNMGGLVGNMTGGTLHSSFAVAALNGSATNKGGLAGINAANLYNSYSNASFGGTASAMGGLVGANSGIVENCYAAGIPSGVSALAGSNSGTIQFCYSDAVGDGFVGSSNSAPSGCGLYGAVQASSKHLDYLYRDNLITKNTNTYVGADDAVADGINVYADNHIPVWNGLLSALNQWVRANPRSVSGLSPWYRPMTTSINGDLPVLGFKKATSIAAADGSPKTLRYGSLDDLLTACNGSSASVFHYGKAKNVANIPTANVSVYINENAVLLQASSPDPGAFNATVGVTFDNSDHGQHAFDFWGNRLLYDWHFMSSPLHNPLTGAEHSSYMPSGNPSSTVDITAIGGYFPTGLPMALHDPDWKWDFYSYYEPEYHWINLKRNKKNHYHQDGGTLISYNEDDQDLGNHTAHLIPGKGYMMAISQNTFMNQCGTLNRGSVTLTLYNQEPDDLGGYGKGWNLVGNPFQAYLDLEAVDRLPVYVYDAEMGVYVPYAKAASSNPVTPSRFLHPHQAFFMLADTDGDSESFSFLQSWADTTATPDSYYRHERHDYPLVNLFAENSVGQRDLAVLEFHRPETGGAEKLEAMHTAPFSLAAHHEGKSYGIFFASDDLERVPLHFKTEQDDLMTLTWNTHNGLFSRLRLVDNLTGTGCDMLTHDSYTFVAHATDYDSRFYITYECSGTGIGENDGNTASGADAFAYYANGEIHLVETNHGASLQIVDILGRVIVNSDGAHNISTNGMTPGVYVLRLTTANGTRTQKIILN